jgi:large subunit ribosomal protein L1
MGKTKTAFVGEEPAEDKNRQKHQKTAKSKEEKIHLAGLKGGQRVKIVEAAPTEEKPVFEASGPEDLRPGGKGSPQAQEEGEKSKKKIVEKIRSKKYQEAKAKVDREKFYKPKEAVKFVKEMSYSKFDGTMELHIVVKKAGISAQVTLPHSAGREKKVEVASDATVEKLKAGKIDFDVLVATPEFMPKLVPFAKVLGPKGLMPNPKNGTLVTDPKKAKSFSGNSLNLKTEKEAPLIHTVIGKNSQKDEEIVENTEAILTALGGAKQIVKAYMKSTMSPSIKLAV